MPRLGEVARADDRVVILDLDTQRYFSYYGDERVEVGDRVTFETDADHRYVKDLQKLDQ